MLLPLLALHYIQTIVDDFGDGSDLSVQFSLNCVQIETALVCDEADCEPQVTETTRATYSVEVGLRCLGKVKVDDHGHSLNVNASCQHV